MGNLNMSKNLLVVGGCGFIGTNLLEMVLEQNLYEKVFVWDKFTYAANEKKVKELEEKYDNLTVVAMHADDWEHCQNEAHNLEKIDGVNWKDLHVINLASSSHVDRSIQGPLEFVGDNCVSACNLLELLRQKGFGDKDSSSRLIHVSTDEVNCTTNSGKKKESDPILPNSPYSAMKAAAENMCRAYQKTYNFPVLVTRCGNNYGSYQHWEKFIPTICNALKQGREIPVYGNGQNIRTWVDVKEHCSAILWCLNRANLTYYDFPQILNIGGIELENIDVVKMALEEFLGRSITKEDVQNHVEYVEDRKGHDFAYLINDSQLKNYGYIYKYTSLQGFLRNLRTYLND